MYLGPYSAGRFGQMGMSANRPKLDQFCILKHFPVQNQNSKGVSYMKKIAISFSHPPASEASRGVYQKSE